MKVLIVGLGSIAKKHIKALRFLDKNVELFAIRSSRKVRDFFGVENLYSWKELDLEAFDFALISNPTAYHFEVMQKLQNNQLPLFIEKPLFAKTGMERESLVKDFTRHNRITYVGCNLRFLDCLKKVKELLQDEHINEVNSYSGSYLPDWRPDQDFRKVYSSQAGMGGGVHLDLIHELDYIYWIFGKPLKANKLLKNSSHLNIDAVDYANYRWEYNGYCASIILNYYRKSPKRSLEIVCGSGTYYVDLLKNKIFFDEKEIFSSHQNFINTYTDQMRFFIEEVMEGKEKINTAKEAYNILELCLD